MTDPDYYGILEVEYDATHDEVRQSYHCLREQHKGNRRELLKLIEAWRVLGSPGSREDYDSTTRSARMRSRQPSIRTPAKTDMPEELGPGLRQPAKTDVPEVQPPGLRQAAATNVEPPAERQQRAPTEVQDVELEGSHSLEQRRPTENEIATVQIRRRGEEPWRLGLKAGLHLIGRGGKGECAILLPDPVDRFISREHATLRVEEEGCSIRDEYSVNGIWMDGKRILPGQWVSVEGGCAIRIEDYVLMVVRT